VAVGPAGTVGAGAGRHRDPRRADRAPGTVRPPWAILRDRALTTGAHRALETGTQRVTTGISPHLVWDWNGTLLDDGAALIDAVTAGFRAAGLAPVTALRHQEHFQRPVARFFDRLAGRAISADERRVLQRAFDDSYAGAAPDLRLAADAVEALTWWRAQGGTQTVLSMCDQVTLDGSIEKYGLGTHFEQVDGHRGTGPDVKAWHLRRHLDRIGRPDGNAVTLVGDTVDDALAAVEAQIRCVLYHPGHDMSLQSLSSLRATGLPVARSLTEAAKVALDLAN
jgi:phosphoglycolate phosphatase-like HAD superfamily hydrolase